MFFERLPEPSVADTPNKIAIQISLPQSTAEPAPTNAKGPLQALRDRSPFARRRSDRSPVRAHPPERAAAAASAASSHAVREVSPFMTRDRSPYRSISTANVARTPSDARHGPVLLSRGDAAHALYVRARSGSGGGSGEATPANLMHSPMASVSSDDFDMEDNAPLAAQPAGNRSHAYQT